MKLTLAEAKKLADSEWDYLFRVEEVETPAGTVARRTSGPLEKHYGAPIAQQFRVRLHSATGPLHWIAILEDGSALLD